MNIEIANRLVSLRKRNQLSQEALAEKLGISRQAVSKWERAEASPDTDNLIMLAKLYQVSLDQLLKTEEDIPAPECGPEAEEGKKTMTEPSCEKEGAEGTGETPGAEAAFGPGEYGRENGKNCGPDADGGKKESEDREIHVGSGGIHVKDKDGSRVYVGLDGIRVDDREKNRNVHIGGRGVYVNGERYDKDWLVQCRRFPVAILVCVVYLLIGVFFNAWHPGWMLFLLIPLWYSLVEAVIRRNALCFAWPVFATILFLCLGFFLGMWHPGWIIFITIPLYYSLVPWLRQERKPYSSEKTDNGKEDIR